MLKIRTQGLGGDMRLRVLLMGVNGISCINGVSDVKPSGHGMVYKSIQ